MSPSSAAVDDAPPPLASPNAGVASGVGRARARLGRAEVLRSAATRLLGGFSDRLLRGYGRERARLRRAEDFPIGHSEAGIADQLRRAPGLDSNVAIKDAAARISPSEQIEPSIGHDFTVSNFDVAHILTLIRHRVTSSSRDDARWPAGTLRAGTLRAVG